MPTLREEVDRVLSELGGLVGAALQLDGEGRITMEFGDGVLCTLEVPDHVDRVFIFTEIGHLPRIGREAILSQALKRNHFGLTVPGAAIALDFAGETLLLCHSAPADPELADSLPDTVHALVIEAGELRSLLHTQKSSDEPPAVDHSAATMYFRG